MNISKLNQNKIIFFSVKAFLIWILLTVIVIFFGNKLLIPLLHYFASVANFFIDGYLFEIKTSMVKSEPAIIMIVKNLNDITSSENAVLLNSGYTTAIYAHTVNILVPLVILFSLILAWPIKSLKQGTIMIASGIIFLILVLLFTVPFQLFGIFENELNNIALNNQQNYAFSLVHYWQVFCDAGGVWLLAILGAVISIVLGNWQIRQRG